MSYSYLYGVDVDGKGVVLKEYRNSWSFSPKVWDILAEKFSIPNGFLLGIEELEKTVDSLEVDNFERHIWELTMQRGIFSEDKEIIVSAIQNFIERYIGFSVQRQYSSKREVYTSDNFDRFREIAKDIEEIDVDKYPYFIFKNTSVDDNVESLFSGWCEETDESLEKTLYDDDNDCWFVLFDQNKITDYCLFRELED